MLDDRHLALVHRGVGLLLFACGLYNALRFVQTHDWRHGLNACVYFSGTVWEHQREQDHQ